MEVIRLFIDPFQVGEGVGTMHFYKSLTKTKKKYIRRSIDFHLTGNLEFCTVIYNCLNLCWALFILFNMEKVLGEYHRKLGLERISGGHLVLFLWQFLTVENDCLICWSKDAC